MMLEKYKTVSELPDIIWAHVSQIEMAAQKMREQLQTIISQCDDMAKMPASKPAPTQTEEDVAREIQKECITVTGGAVLDVNFYYSKAAYIIARYGQQERLEGVKLGLEAAAKYLDKYATIVNVPPVMEDIRALSPESIVGETK